MIYGVTEGLSGKTISRQPLCHIKRRKVKALKDIAELIKITGIGKDVLEENPDKNAEKELNETIEGAIKESIEEKTGWTEELNQGKKRALRLLERRDYSRKELSERLRKDGYDSELIARIMEYLDKYHYLDDARVAGSYIRSRKEYKSKRELEYLLKQKGISEEEIDAALEENYKNEDGSSQEEAVIRKYLQKYRVDEMVLEEMAYEEKQKLAAKLYRKGFGQEKIRKFLKM